MKKLLPFLFLLMFSTLQAQTLFTYGDDSVSVDDFLRAYDKNSSGLKSPAAIRDYLDLYIASRLKIREAKERGYDTLPQLKADLENLRAQIVPAYLQDAKATERMINEAVERSKKNIRLSHIFIAHNIEHSAQLQQKQKRAEDALKELRQGKPFAEVAKKFSDDPSVKENGGDIGWISAFTLPYDLESLAYNTAVNSYSGIYQSPGGFHIFRNAGVRPDVGKWKIAQILLAFPPAADASTKAAIKKRADSIYNRILKGDNFGQLATKFSNDVISASANGQIPAFKSGEFHPDFEKQVFLLTKNDQVSKPFLTSHGYHIVKRLSVEKQIYDEAFRELMRQELEESGRMEIPRSLLAQQVLSSGVYQASKEFDESDVFLFTDSVINFRRTGKPVSATTATPLFTIDGKNFTVNEWINYAQTFRYKKDGSGMKQLRPLYREFMEAMALDHYQSKLENYNADFRRQLNEFREGNLFFEIMQKEIWGPAQMDTIALRKFFNEHSSHYNWKDGADAVIFYATDLTVANSFINELKKSPSSWKQLADNFSEKLAADSARFELSQIPNPENIALRAGSITSPLVNPVDQTVSFAFIIKPREGGQPRSFDESRGLIINDYQAALEKKWLEELRRKYEVEVRVAEWKKVSGGK